MEPDEIRAEVQRRKKRAEDLRIREVVRGLITYRDHYISWLRDDPQFAAKLLYPDMVLSDDEVQFAIGATKFQLECREVPTSYAASNNYDDGDHRQDRFREIFEVRVNDQTVFEFNVEKATEWTQFGPIGHGEQFGDITQFIEGSWIAEITELLRKAQGQSDGALRERNAPREAAELDALKKKFGLR